MTWWHHAIAAAAAFGLGAVVGSFLNVCIWRLPRGESVFRPPSRCPRCRARLAARDNLPILGWLALRGRCRACAVPISPRYPAVEALTGLAFAAIYALGPADPTVAPGHWFAGFAACGAAASALIVAGFLAHDARGRAA